MKIHVGTHTYKQGSSIYTAASKKALYERVAETCCIPCWSDYASLEARPIPDSPDKVVDLYFDIASDAEQEWFEYIEEELLGSDQLCIIKWGPGDVLTAMFSLLGGYDCDEDFEEGILEYPEDDQKVLQQFCIEILRTLENDHDAAIGINWDVIESAVSMHDGWHTMRDILLRNDEE